MRYLLLLLSLNCYAADKFETFCLTQNIYHEARGESLEGQLAVAFVTLNRVNHPDFPKSICDVVYQDSQFSWSLNKREYLDIEKWNQSAWLANRILKGYYKNNVATALYYYNPRKSNPSWKTKYCRNIIKIDQHNFCVS